LKHRWVILFSTIFAASLSFIQRCAAIPFIPAFADSPNRFSLPADQGSRRLQDEFPELRKRYWGQHLWARGYFCATVGAVNEETIREYIENQKWDEDDQGFKITAPSEP
jgi:hypothetical protein